MSPSNVKYWICRERLDVTEKQFEYEKKHTCERCKLFLPYFMDNAKALNHYVKEGLEPPNLSAEELQQKGIGNDWSEYDWTECLLFCLKKALPDHTIEFSASKMFDPDITGKVLNLPDNKCGDFLFFQGAPDLVIKKKGVVSLASESLDEDIIENTYQRPQLKCSHDSCDLPDQLGQLLAYINMLLGARIIRRIYKNKTIAKQLSVDGVLVDKCIRVIELSVTFTAMNEPLKYVVHDYTTDYLTPQSLCMHITNIVCDSNQESED